MWVLNIAEVEGERVQLVPGCELRRATAEEVNELRLLLWYFQARLEPHNPWESATTVHQTGKGVQKLLFEPIPDDRLRYHLLTYEQPSNLVVRRLCITSVLAKGPVFHQGYAVRREFVENGSGCGFGATSSKTLDLVLLQVAWDDDGYFSTLTISDAADIYAIFKRLEELPKNSAAQVRRSAEEFLSVMEIQHRWLRLLGLLGIVESIITHKPDPQDRYQSLVRQIKKKMTLLGSRFVRPLNYQAHLGCAVDPENVWGKMYELRSLVAHGEKPDFSSGKLQLLRSGDVAEAIAVDAVRSLLRQVAHEPELLRYLKDC